MNESRSRNELAGITGFLCFGRGHFVQALQAPEMPVMPLHVGIIRDQRHQQSELLGIRLDLARAFPHGAMTCVEGEPIGGELQARRVDHELLDRDPSLPVRWLHTTLKSPRKAA